MQILALEVNCKACNKSTGQPDATELSFKIRHDAFTSLRLDVVAS